MENKLSLEATNKICAVVNEIADSEQYAANLGRFYAAYQHRAQFPWLTESGSLGQNGLLRALEGALESIKPADQTPIENLPINSAPITNDFRQRLRETTEIISNDPSHLRQLAQRLLRSGIQLEQLDSEEITSLVVRGLDHWSSWAYTNTEQDPW